MLDYKIFKNKFKLPEFSIDHEIKLEIQVNYEWYIQRVSRKDMAVSLEASLWLYYILENYGINRSPRVIDFGSGFSSYVIRLYKRNNLNTKVYTVDDSQVWLYKTHEFLVDKKVNSDNLFFWGNIRRGEHNKELDGQFDFVFYDMGTMDVRRLSFDLVKKRFFTKDKTLFIADDLHHGTYRNYLEGYVKDNGVITMYDVKQHTLDSYGRYMAVIV
jgi:SAM-dependent methyltransferase